MTVYTRSSPGKLNLHLQILAPRPDGFHEIQSLFQTVSLADRLELRIDSLSRGYFEAQVAGPFDFPVEKNLIWKAARAFHLATGLSFRLYAAVDKRIPAGGGMGGGSGNAAVTLTTLNEHFGHPLEMAALESLAAELGSDVPFFIRGGAALVRGRGEKLFPLALRRDLTTVVVPPPEGINTAAAFRLWDGANPHPPREPLRADGEISRCYETDPPGQWPFENSFFNVLAPQYPVLAEIRKILYSEGSDYANLTGSGCCLFGMFEDREIAERAVGSLKARYPGVCMAAPVESDTKTAS